MVIVEGAAQRAYGIPCEVDEGREKCAMAPALGRVSLRIVVRSSSCVQASAGFRKDVVEQKGHGEAYSMRDCCGGPVEVEVGVGSSRVRACRWIVYTCADGCVYVG